MSHPVVTLDSVSSANVIVNILKGETHDGFPVVQQQTESLDVIVFVIYFSMAMVGWWLWRWCNNNVFCVSSLLKVTLWFVESDLMMINYNVIFACIKVYQMNWINISY